MKKASYTEVDETLALYRMDVSEFAKTDPDGRTVLEVPFKPVRLEFSLFSPEFYDYCRENKLQDGALDAVHSAVTDALVRVQITNYIYENTR